MYYAVNQGMKEVGCGQIGFFSKAAKLRLQHPRPGPRDGLKSGVGYKGAKMEKSGKTLRQWTKIDDKLTKWKRIDRILFGEQKL